MKVYQEQLFAAWMRVRKGSQASGIDGVTPDLFAGDVPIQLRSIGQELERESYVARPARGFELAKRSGQWRTIGIPTVRDRIVQRWLLQMSYPVLERQLSDRCYAYRPGYSIYQAVAPVLAVYGQRPLWIVKADIAAFFDSLCWPLMVHHLERIGLVDSIVQLILQQMQAGIVLRGQLWQPKQGVLQGSALSGALANLYLSEFDRRCLEFGMNFIRYGDDCLVLCQSWVEASRTLGLLQDWLADLYLTLQQEKCQVIAPGQSFEFLGHEFSEAGIRSPLSRRASSSRSKERSRGYSAPRPLVCHLRQPRLVLDGQISQENTWSEPMTTLYVTEQGAYVKVQQQQFQVVVQGEVQCSVPVNRVSHLVLFGCANVSHGAVSLALRRRIPILYLAQDGKYFGRLQTAGLAEIEYLCQQTARAQDESFRRQQALSIVLAKLHNSRVVLQRMNRRRSTEEAEGAIAQLPGLMEQAMESESIEELMGYEGQGAHLYFRAYASMLKGAFAFEKRAYRPPTDPVNSLLSLGYTLLSQNVHAMVEVAGLHPHFGNLHKPRRNHPALVCDLVEEFRAPVVDSFVAYLLNSNILTEEDFTAPDQRGGVYLLPGALKVFLKHWEEMLQKQVTHPHTGYKVSYRRCFELQVWEYVQCLMGEQPVYRPMRWEK